MSYLRNLKKQIFKSSRDIFNKTQINSFHKLNKNQIIILKWVQDHLKFVSPKFKYKTFKNKNVEKREQISSEFFRRFYFSQKNQNCSVFLNSSINAGAQMLGLSHFFDNIFSFLIKNKKSNMKSWTPEEDQLLLKAYEKTPSFRRWKLISIALNKKGVIKSQYQCRERYINKLDPQISGVQWKPEQIEQIFYSFESLGSHWSSVQRFIPGRTQSSIKNKFYGTLRNFVRAILKLKGFKVSKLPQDISTNRLMDLYKGEKEFEGFKGFTKISLKILNYRITPRDIKQKLFKDSQKIEELCQVLIHPRQKIHQNSNKNDQSLSQSKNLQHSSKIVKEKIKQGKLKSETLIFLKEKNQQEIKFNIQEEQKNKCQYKIKIQDQVANFQNQIKSPFCNPNQLSYQNFYYNRIPQFPYLYIGNVNQNLWFVNTPSSFNSPMNGSFFGTQNDAYCFQPNNFQDIWYQNFGNYKNQK